MPFEVNVRISELLRLRVTDSGFVPMTTPYIRMRTFEKNTCFIARRQTIKIKRRLLS